jgi:uncharacterized protein YcbK (DUF882 family)
MVDRRCFLKTSLGLGLALAAGRVTARPADARMLSVYNTHTGERARATYWADGMYVGDELLRLDRVLRDHRSNETAAMDPALFDILYDVQQATGARGDFHIISGFRSPATNRMLRQHSDGVAEHSLHTVGKAIDLRLPGYDLDALRRAARSLRAGGVGYYPRSQFVHVDTGRVRTW